MKNAINQQLLAAAKGMLAADPSSKAEQAEAAAALYKAIRSAEAFSEMGYLPPDNFVLIPTTHRLEKRAWRMPNGAKHVELIDGSEATWEEYCRDMAARNEEFFNRRQAR